MQGIKRTFLILLLIIACVGCDQSTKLLASRYLALAEPIHFFNDMFRLQYAENSGAFLSLGESLPDEYRFVVFTLAVFVMLFALTMYSLFNAGLSRLNVTGLGLIIGGGVSNLIDRIVNSGAVIDFLNIPYACNRALWLVCVCFRYMSYILTYVEPSVRSPKTLSPFRVLNPCT